MKKLLAAIGASLIAISAFAASPTTYVFDFADSTTGKKSTFVKNGNIYQSENNGLNFSDLIAGKLPQKGDIIELHFKGKSDIDLPGLMVCLTDDSAKAGYWTNVISQKDCDTPIFGAIKAGETFEGTYTFTIASPVKKNLRVIFFYDHGGADKAGWPKVGKAATLTWEKTGVQSSEFKLSPAAAKPKKYNVDISKVELMFDLAATFDQGTGQLNGYQHIYSISDAFKDRLPVKGDEVTIIYKGISNVEIPTEINAALVENTAAVGWWAELTSQDVYTENVPANKTFTIKHTFKIERDAIEGCSIMIYYKPFDGAKPATWKAAK